MSYLIIIGYTLLNCNELTLKSFNIDVTYDVYRALGSLIYNNVLNIETNNLDLFFGKTKKYQNEKEKKERVDFSTFKQNGLLYTILKRVEYKSEITNENHNKHSSIIYLIITQLIFNFTMPFSNGIPMFINDELKVKCNIMLMDILRIHLSLTTTINYKYNKDSLSFTNLTNRHFITDTTATTTESALVNIDEKQRTLYSKIIVKALQGLENLFISLQSPTTQQQQHQTSWPLTMPNDYQLADILAIIKNLSFYGFNSNSNKMNSSIDEKEVIETLDKVNKNEVVSRFEKLEPAVFIPITESKMDNQSNSKQQQQQENSDDDCDDSIKNKNSFYQNKNNKKNYTKPKLNTTTTNVTDGNNKKSNDSTTTRTTTTTITANSIQYLFKNQVPLIHFNHQSNN
jgi:hypothetical protein